MNDKADNGMNKTTEILPTQNPLNPLTNSRPTSLWRLLIPLVFQAALITAIPAQAIYTHITGRNVILQTMPVDPYDFLRGYSQTLNYDISVRQNLQELPGWNEVMAAANSTIETSFYIILEQPESPSNTSVPKAWKPVVVSRDRPKNLPANQVALKGTTRQYGRIKYGLETYYMPEDQRDLVNRDISQTRRREAEAFVVEIKVDSRGHAVPLSLWVGDRNYRF